ncbi:hypothetical protein CAPTEDRAFT_38651, partial [Capitella teleta]
QPLERIYARNSKPSARIERWVLRLQPYTFRVIYRPGKTNIADALSRLIPKNEGKSVQAGDVEDYVYWVANQSLPIAITLEEVRQAAKEDLYLNKLKQAIEGNDFTKMDKTTQALKDEFTYTDDIILRGARLVVPEDLRK